MTNSQRQHGIGSLAPDEKIVGKPGGLVESGVKQYGIFKKIKKGIKKVFKSPIGKAAMLGLGAYYAPAMWGKAGFGGWKTGAGMLRNKMFGAAAKKLPFDWAAKAARTSKPGIFARAMGGLKDFGYGKAAFLGAGAGLTALPFLAIVCIGVPAICLAPVPNIPLPIPLAQGPHPPAAFAPIPGI